MIEFMIISAPRSASTWASNWLTTDTTLCLHDPLLRWPKEQWNSLQSVKRLGIACTGVALFPAWINEHPARKVILHRELSDVDQSLANIGMTPIGKYWGGVLEKIHGVHLPWSDLFERPKFIYEYLLDLPFDAERHAYLREINIQPNFGNLSVNRVATARLMAELRMH